MNPTNPPPAPVRTLPDRTWEHFALYKSLREAISTLPIYFRTETTISGVMATDLHTLNTVLGATIEEQVVRTLNLIRNTWDPDGRYALYSFARQAQTFPDVRLRKASSNETLVGVELKGWYLLAKETEPSLRFQTTAAACAPQDLIVVVPWVLSNVVSGSPILFRPFIESARYAAEYRNYHWRNLRRTESNAEIDVATGVGPYPSKADQISDKPRSDRGGNFGRLARTGLMDAYMAELNDVTLCGIKAIYWRDFLKAFQDSTTDHEARLALERLRARISETATLPAPKAQAALAIVSELERLLEL
ncbi:MAG TPA: hypothetical protein VKX17_08630 [Planctomycetota bacterium]|nr:hypothetical protein [Planctomycetota bacterium]